MKKLTNRRKLNIQIENRYFLGSSHMSQKRLKSGKVSHYIKGLCNPDYLGSDPQGPYKYSCIDT